MAKYNITERKKKEASYIGALSTSLVEEIYEKILLKFVVEKKYRDPEYTAAKLAEEIGCNARYISAVVHLRYRDNFSQLINDFRIKEAMYMITDRHFADLKMEDVAKATGFANRQCFYSAFFRKNGMTPLEYRAQNAISKKGKKE
ncbi:MAG: helix-turn-helix domain-containing protein, partial [Bacteroidaceae bacterium]|nr:helix-turn-helix domain-containing protein [Bacteroidaceae bacterium]